jgi:hypothetical protein
MENEYSEREKAFLKELNELMKKHKINSLMTGEQGAVYIDEENEHCIADDVYLQFKKDI